MADERPDLEYIANIGRFTRYGFSMAKAMEIALDCQRRDAYALAWLDLAKIKDKSE